MLHWTEQYVPEPNSGCWLWTGSVKLDENKPLRALQNIWRHGRTIKVHASRLVWEDVNGAIPPKMQVLHHCDLPMCINPEHLYLGTNADNTRDRARRWKYCRSKRHWLGDEKSVYTLPSRPHHRMCRQCLQERNAASAARAKIRQGAS